MSKNIPVAILDNFFEMPTLIRKMALSEEFTKWGGGSYPGTRSKFLHQIDPAFARYFNQKVFSLFYDFNIHQLNLKVEGMFQLISKEYEEGWIHNDLTPLADQASGVDWDVAGVVYLNPEAPLDGGTSIYSPNDKAEYNRSQVETNGSWKRRFYSGELQASEITDYRKARDTYNNTFNETIKVNNVFNRLIIYDAAEYHRGNIFFGDTKETSRLTLVFFAKIKPTVWVQNPISRSKSITF
jgi:hypothetical protein